MILAGGTSSRMGRPKQTLRLRGRPLLQHPIDAAEAAGIGEIVVVLGHAADDVRASITLPAAARFVVNPSFDSGQASSLRAGLDALSPRVQAAIVLLGDQPGISPEAIGAVAATHERGGPPIVQASYRGHASHPVLLSREVWEEVRSARGDVGAREVIAAHPEWVTLAELDDDPPLDVDTPEDYEILGGGEPR